MLTASAASARTRRRNAASAPRSRTGQSRTERLTAAAMLAPSAVGVGLFLVAPIAVVVAASLTPCNLTPRPSSPALANYPPLLAAPAFPPPPALLPRSRPPAAPPPAPPSVGITDVSHRTWPTVFFFF